MAQRSIAREASTGLLQRRLTVARSDKKPFGRTADEIAMPGFDHIPRATSIADSAVCPECNLKNSTFREESHKSTHFDTVVKTVARLAMPPRLGE